MSLPTIYHRRLKNVCPRTRPTRPTQTERPPRALVGAGPACYRHWQLRGGGDRQDEERAQLRATLVRRHGEMGGSRLDTCPPRPPTCPPHPPPCPSLASKTGTTLIQSLPTHRYCHGYLIRCLYAYLFIIPLLPYRTVSDLPYRFYK